MSYLIHYGVPGQKWGKRNYQYEDGSLTPEGRIHYGVGERKIRNIMSDLNTISYTEFTKLKSPSEVRKTREGSCHDQVMYELDTLRKQGFNPKAKFLMEVDDKGQGGETHSFVYLNLGKNCLWIENAWGDQAGVHRYKSESDMINDVERKMKKRTSGTILWGDFDDRKLSPGDDLQDVVDKCLE